MTKQAIKIRIYPNIQQQIQINQNFGCCRFVWNQLLNECQIRREQQLSQMSEYDMNYRITSLKKEHGFLKNADSTSLTNVARDLSDAIKRFFKKQNRYPRFKARRFPVQSYTSKMVNQNIRVLDNHHLKVPKLGNLKFHSGRQITGQIKRITIRQAATGKYYASVLIEKDIKFLPKTHRNVGIDLGVADLVITSDGIKIPTRRFDLQSAEKLHHWEKKMARRRQQAQLEIAYDKKNKTLIQRDLSDFKNYQKAKQMVAKYHAKIANQRVNYLHQITTQLVREYDVIYMEDLKTKNLIKNHNLARAISNQAWRLMRDMLTYKAAWYGKKLQIVNPYKTSQICSNCGYDDGKHELNIRIWRCPQCGTLHDRDINAAKNICIS